MQGRLQFLFFSQSKSAKREKLYAKSILMQAWKENTDVKKAKAVNVGWVYGRIADEQRKD